MFEFYKKNGCTLNEKKNKKYSVFSVDVSRIPVNKGIKSRLGWTKYIDLYKIVLPSLNR